MSTDQKTKEIGTLDAVDFPAIEEHMSRDSIWGQSIRNAIAERKLNVAQSCRQYLGPTELLTNVLAYFDFLESNPLQEEKLFSYEGNLTTGNMSKMRAPTLAGLCAWLLIHRDTWGAWRRGDQRLDLKPVVEWAEQVMWDLKYTGAAAGLLNPTIVIRDLGLVEKQQVDSKTTVVIDGDEADL